MPRPPLRPPPQHMLVPASATHSDEWEAYESDKGKSSSGRTAPCSFSVRSSSSRTAPGNVYSWNEAAGGADHIAGHKGKGNAYKGKVSKSKGGKDRSCGEMHLLHSPPWRHDSDSSDNRKRMHRPSPGREREDREEQLRQDSSLFFFGQEHELRNAVDEQFKQAETAL